MNQKVIDFNLPNKQFFIDNHFTKYQNKFPLFSQIEISLTERCTRKCVFCPQSNPDIFPKIDQFFPLDLLVNIAKQLGEIEYSGLITFSGFGEPLIHYEIENIVEVCHSLCGKAQIEIITNGDLLDAEKLKKLFNSGLSRILISLYDGSEQLDYFRKMQEESLLKDKDVVLRKRWKGSNESIFNNRGGLMGKLVPIELNRFCYYPFYMMLIDSNGDCLVCSNDWSRRIKSGNVRAMSLMEVWNGDVLKSFRLQLSASQRAYPPCNHCDADGLIIGKNHYGGWMEYYATLECNK